LHTALDDEEKSSELNSFDIIGRQQTGKQHILGRYMSLIGEFLKSITDFPLDTQIMLGDLNFSDCSLNDDEFSEILKWIRFIPLNYISQLKFSNNLITNASLNTLFAWVSSSPSQDFIRQDLLFLDFNKSKV